MTRNIGDEVTYRIDLLKAVNNAGKVNEIRQHFQEKTGKDIDEIQQVPIIDLILDQIVRDPAALGEIMEQANVSLSAPATIDAIVTGLQTRGLNEDQIIDAMGKASINITPDQIEGQMNNVSSENQNELNSDLPAEEKEEEKEQEGNEEELNAFGLVLMRLLDGDTENKKEELKELLTSGQDIDYDTLNKSIEESTHITTKENNVGETIQQNAFGDINEALDENLLDAFINRNQSEQQDSNFVDHNLEQQKQLFAQHAEGFGLDGNRVVGEKENGEAYTANDQHDDLIIDELQGENAVAAIKADKARQEVVKNADQGKVAQFGNIAEAAAVAARARQERIQKQQEEERRLQEQLEQKNFQNQDLESSEVKDLAKGLVAVMSPEEKDGLSNALPDNKTGHDNPANIASAKQNDNSRQI